MKKIILASVIASAFLSASAMADVTASATASWDASATKDTQSSLVVTPLKSLTFQYAEGIKAFNTQRGAFDITILGQDGATDFKLTSKLVSTTLRSTTNGSTLDIGANWNGAPLNKTTDITLVDSKGSSAGLDALGAASAYAKAGERTSTQGAFDFNVASATSDGSSTAKFEDLPDGYWTGDVRVQFTAVWTTA